MIPASFHFLRPEWLLALALLPVLFVFAARRGASAGSWRSVCDPELLEHLLTKGGAGGGRLPVTLLALGWLVGCLALAGPTWERLPQATYDEPTDTVAVLPLTPSLYERDLPPSRLDRARFELEDLLAKAEGTVGLVIVAEEAYPVTPLTADAHVIQQLIPVLDPGLMPGRGARIDRGIDEARALLDNAGARWGRIVLLTDTSGDVPEEAVAAAERARDGGYVVSVLSLADDAGAEIARAGGGVVVPVRADDSDIERVLAAGSATPGALEGLRQGSAQADVWRDVGPWLVLLPLALAPLAFRRGWAGALALLLALGASVTPEPATAAVADWFERADQQAATAFEDGRHAEAADRFEDPEWQGVAAYRAGDYAAAAEALAGVDSPRARYNRGNALARAGDLEAAIAAYDEVLAADPDDADARHNRDLVQSLLDQQREQQQDPQQGQQQGQQGQQGQQDQAGESGGSAGSGDPDEGSQPEASEGADGASQAGEQGGERPGGEESADQQADAGQDEPAGGAGQETQVEAAPGSSSAEPGTDRAAEDAAGAAASASADERDTGGGASAARDGDASPGTGDVGRDASPSTADGAEGDTQRDVARREAGDRAPEPAEAAGAAAAGSDDREGSSVASSSTPMTERDQEIEHMLNRVPDDPGGLLRERLRRRYAERHGPQAQGPGGR